MSLLRGNSISMGSWSEPRVLIGFQYAVSKWDCDAREKSGEECCASVIKGTLFWLLSFKGAKLGSVISLEST